MCVVGTLTSLLLAWAQNGTWIDVRGRWCVQVTGHAKTVMVLAGGWLFLHEHIGAKELLGMAMAVAGMIGYGYATSQQPSKPDSISLGSKSNDGSIKGLLR